MARRRTRRVRMTLKKGKVTKVSNIVDNVLDRRLELKDVVKAESTTILTAPHFLNISGVEQGDHYNTRDGGQITVKGLDFRYASLQADGTNFLRVIVFTWNDGADPPSSTDILAAPGSWDTLSYYQRHGDVPFKVLYDRTHNMMQNGRDQAYGRINLKFKKGIKCFFNGSAATDYGKRQIWFMAISDSAAVSHPTFRLAGVTYYQDA